MTPEQENQLSRLLKLKRYEQPPPGYFNRFSRQVMDRIAAGEAERHATWSERLYGAAPWLERVFGAFEGRPALAGAFGALVCAVLISSLVFSERTDSPSTTTMAGPMQSAGLPGAVPASLSLNSLTAGPAIQPTLVSSTNPLPPSGGSLFDNYPQLQTQPVAGH